MKKNKNNLLNYLKSQNFMTFATGNNKVWVSSVYYAVDDDINIYFLSDPKSKHCQDLTKNRFVACAIACSSQKVTDKKIGVQIQGTAIQITSETVMKKALILWNKAVPGFENIINFENIKNNKIHSRVYEITPTLIKFLNEELYGPEGYKSFDLSKKINNS